MYLLNDLHTDIIIMADHEYFYKLYEPWYYFKEYTLFGRVFLGHTVYLFLYQKRKTVWKKIHSLSQKSSCKYYKDCGKSMPSIHTSELYWMFSVYSYFFIIFDLCIYIQLNNCFSLISYSIYFSNNNVMFF